MKFDESIDLSAAPFTLYPVGRENRDDHARVFERRLDLLREIFRRFDLIPVKPALRLRDAPVGQLPSKLLPKEFHPALCQFIERRLHVVVPSVADKDSALVCGDRNIGLTSIGHKKALQ